MINPELMTFLERPVMILVATADAAGLAPIGRGIGLTVTGGTSLDVFISRSQWPELVDRLVPGTHCALTASDPPTYRTFQFKGIVEARLPSTLAEQERSENYIAAMSGVLRELGVSPHQISCWFTRSQTARISLRLTELYSQTPGPSAGARMAQA